jgi:FkbM family methyltransferase
VGTTARAIRHDLRGGARVAADAPSFLRLATDLLLGRLAGHVAVPRWNRERTIRVCGGIELCYRLNRGDLQSVREVWIDEVYRLPFDLTPHHVVDLGANIGLTSLWLAYRYGCRTIIAVEPSPENARLARLNLQRNHIQAEVVEAAVGPCDGTAYFQEGRASNLGRLAPTGRPVRQVSMPLLLQKLPSGVDVDLLKVDIEGSEEPLLRENLDWLGRVRSIIAEFHPDMVDYPSLIRKLEAQGFRYIPAHSAVGFDSMDAFLRKSPQS